MQSLDTRICDMQVVHKNDLVSKQNKCNHSITKISPIMLQGNPLDLEVKQDFHTSVHQHAGDLTKS